MRLEINFERSLDDVEDPFAPLPDGYYDAVLEAMEDKEGVFVLPMNLDDGKGNSGKFWDRFRVHHEREDVARINIELFQRLCVALGFSEIPEDGDEFAGKECRVKLKTKGEFQNVARYMALKADKPAKPAPKPAAKPTPKPMAKPAAKPKQVEPEGENEELPF